MNFGYTARMTDSPAPAAPLPRAPGTAELFEQSLAALVNPDVFRAAARRPAPAFGTAGGLILACGAAAIAVDLAHVAAGGPNFLRGFSPAAIAAVGAAALALYAVAVLALSIVLLGLAKAIGGKGEFDRGLQAAAMISVLAPVQMLCNWFPIAWIVPTVLAAWSAAGALEGLFGVNALPAKSLCALAASVVLGLQVAARFLVGRALPTIVPPPSTASQTDADLRKSVSRFSGQAEASASASGAPSGLELLRGPSDDGGAPSGSLPTPTAATRPPSVKGAQADALGMLDALTPMLDNPALGRNITTRQKADLADVQSMIRDLRAQIRSGRSLGDPEFSARMARSQRLLMKTLADAAAPPGGRK